MPPEHWKIEPRDKPSIAGHVIAAPEVHMQSGADPLLPIGQPSVADAPRPASSIFGFLRRRNRAIERDEAISTWGIARREPTATDRYPAQSFAREIIVRSPDGVTQPLQALLSTTTLIFYVGAAMALTPGLERRLHRRAATLGPGVRLLCVTPSDVPSLPTAYVDIDGTCARIQGAPDSCVLISIDREGCIFDIQSDAEALLDWLWNDPRPRSRRATDI